MLVRAPVEMSQAEFAGVAMSARYMASIAVTSERMGATGVGSRVTPPRPDSPAVVQPSLVI